MKEFIKLILIFLILVSTVFVKYYFFLHPSKEFFALSNSDIMAKAPEFLRKPAPIPYIQSYIEYPVIIGVWGTIIGYLSSNARDFFFINGILLSLFSTINIFLAQKICEKLSGKCISLFKFLTPSVIFFTFFNWDALAVLLLLLSIYFFLKEKYYISVFFSTFGAWAKLFPVFALLPVFFDFLTKKKLVTIFFGTLIFIIISILINLPFYLGSRDGWALFFTFSSKRPPNIDSVWSGIYVITDKLFGPSFYYKRYYDSWITYISSGLLLVTVAIFYLKKLAGRFNSRVVVDTAFLISAFLLTSKVYSPQYNLWIVLLLIIIGVSYKKIMFFELFNILLTWSVFQYFREVFILGHQILPFPYFKLTYSLSILRHLALLLIAYDIWKLSFTKEAKVYEETS